MSTFLLIVLVALGIIAAAAVLWLLVTLLLVAPGKYPANDPARLLPKGELPTPIAHRGLHDNNAGIPENSLAAFRNALTHGFGVELDVNLTTDDQVVVFHDNTLRRICGDDRRVCDCSYAELQALSLLGTGERIPLLSEVLTLMNGQQTMIVELKNTTRRELLCEKTLALLKAYDGPYCIESFHPGIVTWFRRHAPEIVRGQLAQGLRHYGSKVPGLFMALSLCNIAARPHFSAFRYSDVPGAVTLKLYRLLGGKLVAWTVRDAKDYRLYRRFFDVIIFEGPDTPLLPEKTENA